jgi:hypothetical protein
MFDRGIVDEDSGIVGVRDARLRDGCVRSLRKIEVFVRVREVT